jgi:uncharacterized membrane protein YczE
VEHSKEWFVILKKMPQTFFGLFLYALGIIEMLYSNLGTSPWDTFNLGVINYVPITFGQGSQLIGLFVLAASYFIGVIPGIASILNMYFIGFFIDIIDNTGLIRTPGSFIGRLALLVIGILTIGWATYFYLKVELGAGPRDGLMEGLVKKLDRPVWLIRGTIEITVLAIGYLLGGPVGIGTLITAFTMGFSVQLAFKIGRYDSKTVEHENIIQTVKRLKSKEKEAL